MRSDSRVDNIVFEKGKKKFEVMSLVRIERTTFAV